MIGNATSKVRATKEIQHLPPKRQAELFIKLPMVSPFTDRGFGLSCTTIACTSSQLRDWGSDSVDAGYLSVSSDSDTLGKIQCVLSHPEGLLHWFCCQIRVVHVDHCGVSQNFHPGHLKLDLGARSTQQSCTLLLIADVEYTGM